MVVFCDGMQGSVELLSSGRTQLPDFRGEWRLVPQFDGQARQSSIARTNQPQCTGELHFHVPEVYRDGIKQLKGVDKRL